MEQRICAWCGEPFVPKRHNSLTCCGECAYGRKLLLEHWKWIRRRREKKRQAEEAGAKEEIRAQEAAEPAQTLDDAAVEASRKGISYGELMAQKSLCALHAGARAKKGTGGVRTGQRKTGDMGRMLDEDNGHNCSA